MVAVIILNEFLAAIDLRVKLHHFFILPHNLNLHLMTKLIKQEIIESETYV